MTLVRVRRLSAPGLGAILLFACAHDDRRLAREPEAPAPLEAPPQPRSSYALADSDPFGGPSVVLPLGSAGVSGLVVERNRFVIGRGQPRRAADLPPTAIVGAARSPTRFGGGFLFWTASALYRANAFDSPLVPIARFSEPVESVSFGPRAVVVHGRDGARWAFGLPDGKRVAIDPVGTADVASLDDGRALAWTDQGTALVTVDHGAHWADVTAQLKGLPTKVLNVDDDVWLVDSSSNAARLESDGRLSWFDAVPTSSPAPELRPIDPRWRGAEAPLRAVFRAGAALDDKTGVVVNSGDLVRVDLRTGAVLSVAAGPFPPDADCEAIAVPGDIVFACETDAGADLLFSHGSSGDGPVLERSFVSGAGGFIAGDDGALAHTGSCQGGSDRNRVCVRSPGGNWQEQDISGLTADGGASDAHVLRWIPRADGTVVALVFGTSPGIYDPAVQSLVTVEQSALDLVFQVEQVQSTRLFKRGRFAHGRHSSRRRVDTSWSFGPGDTLRGWLPRGTSVELGLDGKLTPSVYSFDVAEAGALALGRSSDGRVYQSTDHGVSWIEVEAPPTETPPFETVRCSSAGCDLGAFYRFGWPTRAPMTTAASTVSAPAPLVRVERGLELSCRPRGGVASKALPRTASSPEDLGLGATRLPVPGERSEWAYVRNAVVRSAVTPVRAMSMDDDGNSLRAVFSGFGTFESGDTISVSGPNKSALNLRRDVAFIAPFDPAARILHTTIAMSDVVSAGRRVGMTTDEILGSDVTESGMVIPLTSMDPTAASDVAIHNPEHGLVALVRGEHTRVSLRASTNGGIVASGVVLPGDETAFLELESSGAGHVFKVSSSGTTDLFDVTIAANEAYYPANPDALAVGPKGDLVVIRTPSGREPASAFEPAYAFAPALPPVALAPWSRLELADDPACKADPSGYRAVLHLVEPWIRVKNPDLRALDFPMIARVRWSEARVCLEGFEVKLPNTELSVAGPSGREAVSVATWLVARGGTYARVGITEGIEWRQALDCSVAAP